MQKFTRSLIAIGAVLGLIAIGSEPAKADTTHQPQHTELIMGERVSVEVHFIERNTFGEAQKVTLLSATIGCDELAQANVAKSSNRVLADQLVTRAKGESGVRIVADTGAYNDAADVASSGGNRSFLESQNIANTVVSQRPLSLVSGSQHAFAEYLADNRDLLHLNL